MKLSVLDLAMIIDTLAVSVNLTDDSAFGYISEAEARMDLLTRLDAALSNVYVTIEVADK